MADFIEAGRFSGPAYPPGRVRPNSVQNALLHQTGVTAEVPTLERPEAAERWLLTDLTWLLKLLAAVFIGSAYGLW